MAPSPLGPQKNRPMAVFDIDQTLVNCQSQERFLRYLLRRSLISLPRFLCIYAYYATYRIGLARDPQRAMEYAYRFLGGMPAKKLDGIIDEFFETTLRATFYPEMLGEIDRRKGEGCAIVLVSNAVMPIARRVAREVGADYVLASELETKNAVFTGKVLHGLWDGVRKVEAIRGLAGRDMLTFENSWGYSDHESDIPMLELMEHPVAVHPTRALSSVAENRNWRVIRPSHTA